MTDAPDTPPPIVPAGQMAWLNCRTGYIEAGAFPRAGIGFRPSGELLLAGGGEVFAAMVTPEDALMLAAILAAWAEERERAAMRAVAAADAGMSRVFAGTPGNA